MRKNPQRLAWAVLWAGFALFCVLITAVPVGIRHYLLTATEEQETHLQRIAGTPLVRRQNGGGLIPVLESTQLLPGDQVILDGSARATLDLFDRSFIDLYSSTDMELVMVQAPRFGVSDRPNEIQLSLTGGLARVGVALPGERDTRFELLTPHTLISVSEGSYRVEVTNQATSVTVLRGGARVGSGASSVMLLQGMRTRVDLSGVPTQPLSAAQNLIENGDFQEPLSTNWVTRTVVLSSGVEPPQCEVVEDGGRQAVRLFRRQADDGNHTEVSIHQSLEQDVRDFDRLEVALAVQIDFQSLSGGGMASSEFPVQVRLTYKDQWGNDQFWTHGFYYQNSAGYAIWPDAWGQPMGEQIPRAVWYPYESGNLLELLGNSRPMYVTGLTVYASGWNYDARVSEVQLIVE
ncbi:MAG: FecR domain-containing protein [Anaerolineae bacterium]|nr:FecR domain-containing protein [Anaerolineae bacterium]